MNECPYEDFHDSVMTEASLQTIAFTTWSRVRMGMQVGYDAKANISALGGFLRRYTNGM